MKKYIKQIIVASVIAVAIICFYLFRLNRFFTYNNVNKVRDFILQYKIAGPFIIYCLYVVFNLICLPTLFFNFLCGYLYGIVWGYILALSGMIIGLISSFYGCRYLFKNDFQRRFGNYKLVETINNYTKTKPLLMVIFFRIFFIFPYNMQNVVYGLTSIKATNYIIGSAIGVAPITFAHVLCGYLIDASVMNPESMKNLFMWIGICIGIFASIFFTSILVKIFFNKKAKKQTEIDDNQNGT